MMQDLQTQILKLLEQNASLNAHQISVMLNTDEATVTDIIRTCEQDGTIHGYKTIINWEKFAANHVTAMIELKITPKRDTGFDEIARQIMEFDEVDSVYLMSGGYDLLISVSGTSLQDVASFVAKRLSTIDGVLSTATHFLLQKYKENGIDLCNDEEVERRTMQL